MTGRAAYASRLLGLCFAAALLAACQPAPEVRWHTSDTYPQRLSDWGVLQRIDGRLTLGEGVEPYTINTPLFSDYALKLRTYYLPDGEAMGFRSEESFVFPVGSIITKTFFYPVEGGVAQAVDGWSGDLHDLDAARYRLLETRLLVRQANGWDALPYVWDGDDARLRLTGAVIPLDIEVGGEQVALPYVVPARSECAGCHATDHTSGALQLIGLKAWQLRRNYPGATINQLEAWHGRGHLDRLPADLPEGVRWDDPDGATDARARAYLDSNCGHCHNPQGAADTSGLLLDLQTSSSRALGFCKPPVAAGRGTGGRAHAIEPGDPDASILIYRMTTSDPATRMPETGRTLIHAEGVSLLRDWVAGLPGACVEG